MAVLARAPRPALREQVRSYYGFREEAEGPVRRREGPGSDVVLVLTFGDEWLIDGARRTSFVGGLHDRQVRTEHAGRSAGIQVNLAPPSAYALLGVPMHALAHRTVALDDLLGREAGLLVERLQEARTWPRRFELLDAAFARRFADAPRPSEGVVWAYDRLHATHGRARIAALAEELGWSRKRLAERFREQVGVPPKTVARVLRFERAAALAERGGKSWAEIAFECGYYDQSHLVNEFRAVTGRTPGQYAHDAAAGVTFFQDAEADAS